MRVIVCAALLFSVVTGLRANEVQGAFAEVKLENKPTGVVIGFWGRCDGDDHFPVAILFRGSKAIGGNKVTYSEWLSEVFCAGLGVPGEFSFEVGLTKKWVGDATGKLVVRFRPKSPGSTLYLVEGEGLVGKGEKAKKISLKQLNEYKLTSPIVQ